MPCFSNVLTSPPTTLVNTPAQPTGYGENACSSFRFNPWS